MCSGARRGRPIPRVIPDELVIPTTSAELNYRPICEKKLDKDIDTLHDGESAVPSKAVS